MWKMSNYFVLESQLRNKAEYPNPAEFEVEPAQTRGWFREPRRVRALSQNPQTMSLDFVSAIEVKHVVTPYHITDPPGNPPVVPPVDPIPYLYLDLHSRSYNDQYLINTIGGSNRDARFLLIRDKIFYDDVGRPVWVLWTSAMEQVLRFKRDDPLFFRLYTADGKTLPIVDSEGTPDPKKQIMTLFGVTPYSRDGDYDNHLLDYLS